MGKLSVRNSAERSFSNKKWPRELARSGDFPPASQQAMPVTQITSAPPERRTPRPGGMKGPIRFNPGWDAPVDPDRFLEEIAQAMAEELDPVTMDSGLQKNASARLRFIR